jgi:hypothetical protein
MEKKIIKEKAISKTLKLMVNNTPENWHSYNNPIKTKIVKRKIKSPIQLKKGELPILEWNLEDNFTIITTDRIISSNGKVTNEIALTDFVGFGQGLMKNYNNQEKSNKKIDVIPIKSTNEKTFFIKIDSNDPAYFAKNLIMNLVNYLQKGKWMWDI